MVLMMLLDLFSTLCRVEADTSLARKERHTRSDGRVYYTFDYEVVMLFGPTEMSAQIAWKEDVSSHTTRLMELELIY